MGRPDLRAQKDKNIAVRHALSSQGGCKLTGEYWYAHSDMVLKRWGGELSGNSVPVAHSQLVKSIWTASAKSFYIQTQRHRATRATVWSKTQFVLCPLKYQSWQSPGIPNQCFKLIRVTYRVLATYWLYWSFSLYFMLSNFLFSSLIFLPNFILASWVFLLMYLSLCGFSGLKYVWLKSAMLVETDGSCPGPPCSPALRPLGGQTILYLAKLVRTKQLGSP